MSYIEFKNTNKFYGSNHVLKDINLKIKKGEFVTLLGPSGCGKSTLLRSLAGLEEVSSGQIILDGEDITYKEPKDRNIGMVFQQYSLFPNMTVEENLAFGLKLKKLPKEEINERIKSAISIVALEGKEKAYPHNLSGGQQQRVALARGIVMQPKVLLLDEPLSAIDAKLRKSLQLSIREIHEKLNLTTIFVTHDQDEAMIMSDVIHLFHDGIIEQSGTPIEVYTRPTTPFVASFIGNYNVFEPETISKITNTKWQSKVAIRPETIMISKNPIVNDDKFKMEGTIRNHTARGNVLRYSIDVNGVKVYADALFRSSSIFEDNEKVYLSVAEHNCINI